MAVKDEKTIFHPRVDQKGLYGGKAFFLSH